MTKQLTALAAQVAPSVPYERWIQEGWTDEQLRAKGYLEPAEATTAPTLDELKTALDRANAAKQATAPAGGPAFAAACEEARRAHRAYWEAVAESKGPPSRDKQAELDVGAFLKHWPKNAFLLPNDNFVSDSIAAERVFSYFATTGELYRRGPAVVELDQDSRAVVLKPTAFRSRLTKNGRTTLALKAGNAGQLVLAQKHCSDDIAKVLLSASETRLLPEIKLIVAMPLLVEVDGKLMLAQPGYNGNCGVLVTGNTSVRDDVPLAEAAAALADLLRDFKFATRGDRSRGIAGLISPCLRMGGFLHGNALIDTVEADESQAGKGTKCELTHAIYGETPYSVVQREGGVGSLDESLSTAIMSGAPFIVLDNLRGSLKSTVLEAAVTPVSSDKRTPVRVPFLGEIRVDMGRTLFQATSNGFSSTKDLANRLLVTRLLKQAGDYAYHAWDGLGLLQHVAKYRGYYLSCVHAVVRYWHASGKPCLATKHTFKPWAGTLDWIVQHVFGGAPLLEGHEDAASIISNRGLSWLRQLAHAVVKGGQGDSWLRAGDLRVICEREGCLPDGVKLDWGDDKIEPAIGRAMHTCFGSSTAVKVVVDGITVTRTEHKPADNNWKPTKFYMFAKARA
jgi:hypothetical protein